MSRRQACRAVFKAGGEAPFEHRNMAWLIPALAAPFSYLMARAKELIMHLNSTCYPV